jgi:hypothetical protein
VGGSIAGSLTCGPDVLFACDFDLPSTPVTSGLFTDITASCSQGGEVITTLENLEAEFTIFGDELDGELTVDFGFGASLVSFDAEPAGM